MSEIPPGAHLFGVPPQVAPPRTERTITFRGCHIGYIVNVDPTGRVLGYEQTIQDPNEETIYIFKFDQKLRDFFLDQLVSLPDVGTVPDEGSDNGNAA